MCKCLMSEIQDVKISEKQTFFRFSKKFLLLNFDKTSLYELICHYVASHCNISEV